MGGQRQRAAVWAASLAVLGLGGWAGTALTADPMTPATAAVVAGPTGSADVAAPATTLSAAPVTATAPPATAAPPVPTSRTVPVPVHEGVAAFEAQVLALVNQERAAVGCPAVTPDSRLAAAARAHSTDMAANGYVDHTSPDGTDFATRISDTGYRWSAAAENIAMGQRDPAEVMLAWMNSDGHRRNILNCGLSQLGVGLAYDTRDRPYWTQDFASPA